MYQPYCLYTSVAILCASGARYARQRNRTNALLLLVGITSVLHHRRLDRWHYYDVVTLADWSAAALLIAHMYATHGFRRPWQNALVSYAVSVVLLNRLDAFRDDLKVPLHASVHGALLAYMCVLGD